MKKTDVKGWTAEELVAELRLRARRNAGGLRGIASKATPRVRDHKGELKALPTVEVAKLAKGQQRAIYGADDRQDLYKVTAPAVKKAAKSVVALVKTTDLTEEADGSFTLATESYKDAYDLCPSEAFADQPIGCFCSGFLVAPDVIATAGHCVEKQADLADIRFVFDFRMTGASNVRDSFPADDVYAGQTLLGRKLASDGTDWALVRLDRPVVGRAPVKVRKSGRVTVGQKLFVIGHPCGLPQKYAPGAEVRDNSAVPFFVANLDTYGGNSGSPVFDQATQTVEGILVRGETDFVESGNCQVSLVCPTTGCRGEDVTRAAMWVGKIPAPAKAKSKGKAAASRKSRKR